MSSAPAALAGVLPIAAGGDGEFHGPSLEEFFPPVIAFEGTPFELNRIMLIRLLVVALLLIWLFIATRKMSLVPKRGQVINEFLFGFVRNNIIIETLGEKDGKRFMPVLMAMFFFIVGMNVTGIVPGLNIAGSSVIGLPLVLALVSYVLFIYAGLRKHPGSFLKNSLFPSGVPWYLYFIVTPIEFISTFILRPVTLAIRLLMNMVAGHMLLVLCFSATHFFLFTAGGFFGLFSIGTFAFGFAFTLFELLVAVLQAYVFTLLTAVYIQLALAEEH
ncbi:F0F1 ATP synthase subunit A [Homoserinibacter sp. YIM 151385]|uniref:F0F1 ATP synthase subunit A n=1 Tax=Homoserinibacter sp. YIM 151385 TaxID=2985506 RepID=UPI0022F05FE7|nr:F0F1 ATP synthase subunit A [Homoserinibacter sp. YIM 151385]WBU38286.1 F0F1 ATP synthase subunit A [Homoserinibacter sp. YIM 151385]